MSRPDKAQAPLKAPREARPEKAGRTTTARGGAIREGVETEERADDLRLLQRQLGNRRLAALARSGGAARSAGDPLEREAGGLAGRLTAEARRPGGPLSPSGRPAAAQGAGPLASPLRAFFEERLGRSFGDVRLGETGSAALRSAAGRPATATAEGADVRFAPGALSPERPGGFHRLAHELVHVAQQGAAPARSPSPDAGSAGPTPLPVFGRAPVSAQGYDPAPGPACGDGPVASMPEPVSCEVPAQVPTTLTIPSPAHEEVGEAPAPDDLVLDLGVPVESSESITLYAVDIEEVFETEAEALAPRCEEQDPDFMGPPPIPTFGGIAWTAQGPIDVVAVTPNFVVTTSYVRFAVGAAVFSLAHTSEGLMLVDAGVQMGRPNGLPGNPVEALADAATNEIRARVGNQRIVKVLLTHVHADHVNLLPRLAEHLAIGTIQINAAQAARPMFQRVLAAIQTAQQTYVNTNLPAQIRAAMEGERDAWVAERNLAERSSPERLEAAWREHVSERIVEAQRQVRFPKVELLIGGEGGQPLLIEAEIHPSAAGLEARLPPETSRGGAIEQPLRQGPVTTFTHPESDQGIRFHPDTHSANYIVTLRDGTQLVVVADPRDKDFPRIRENFERALREAGHQPTTRLIEAGHHQQSGMITTRSSGALRGHLVGQPFLVEMTAILAEMAAQTGADGQPVRSAVIGGAAESRISPANIWFFRSLGYETYVTTDTRTVEMLSILDQSGERLGGLEGTPRAGGRPSQAVLLRSGLEIVRLQRQAQGMREAMGETGSPDEVSALNETESRLAEVRRLTHEYANAFNRDIGRSPTDSTKPTVAPAPGVETGATEMRALVSYLDSIDAARPEASRAAPLSDPVLVMVDRTANLSLSDRHRQIREHMANLSRLEANLAPGEVPEGQRLDLLVQKESLVRLWNAELVEMRASPDVPQEQIEFIERQVSRFEAGARDLRQGLKVEAVARPDPSGGGRSRTELVIEKPVKEGWTRGRQRLEKGFGVAGRAMGGVMILHHIHAADELFDRVQSGDANAFEAVVGTVYQAHGISVGVRMLRLQPVNMAEFVVLAVLDVSVTALADYDSKEERNAAILRSSLAQTINLACFALGGHMMKSGNSYVAGAGFIIMFLGTPILHGLDWAFDLFDRIEQATSFDPSEVTEVRQDLRDLMEQYRAAVGAVRLAQRDLDNLEALGAQDPQALRQAANTTVAAKRREALELEPRILESFEAAYQTARTSYSGLHALDGYRELFARLQAEVWKGTERGPGGAEYESLVRRFQGMERILDLSQASPETIQGMDQWAELDDALDDLHDALFETAEEDIDWADTLEDVRSAEKMLRNARYRLDPAAQGPYRKESILGKGTPARQVYEEMLRSREERYSRHLSRLGSLSAGGGLPVQPATATFPSDAEHEAELEPGSGSRTVATDPQGYLYRIEIPAVRDLGAATSRVRQLRQQLEIEIQQLSGKIGPGDLDPLWASSANLERRYESLLREKGLSRDFLRLEGVEMALRGAIGQARSFATLEGGGEAAQRELAEEIEAAESLMRQRSSTHSLLLRGELARTRREIERVEEQALTVALGGSPSLQLDDEEREALETETLEELGAGISSVQSQLGRLQLERQISGARGLQLYSLTATSTWSSSDFGGAIHTDPNALVGATGGSREDHDLWKGGWTEYQVVAINPAAVQQIGRAPAWLDSRHLAPVQVRDVISKTEEKP